MKNSVTLQLWTLFSFVMASAVLGEAQLPVPTSSAPGQLSKIAFVTGNATKRFDIFQVNPDGSGLRLITQHDRAYMNWNCCPAWSPDGKELAFVSSDLPALGRSHAVIFILDVLGDTVRALFRDDTTCLLDPSWSPDATHLVFARGVKSRKFVGHFLQHRTEICIETELFSMGLDGSGLRQLTQDPTASSRRPAWSPDGRAIAYVSRSKAKEAGKADIFLMDADGSNPRQLTKGGAAEINVDPSWSPDGTEIRFCSNRNGGNEVYVMNRDGGGVRQLTHGTRGRIFHPSWSPDGLQVVFGKGDASAIYIMNADGTNVRVLEKSAWHPDFGKAADP